MAHGYLPWLPVVCYVLLKKRSWVFSLEDQTMGDAEEWLDFPR